MIFRRVSRERRAQRRAVLAHHSPVVPRRSDQQDHTVYAAIAPLRLASSLQGLEVVEPGLGVDPDRAGPIELDVPGAQVTLTTDGNLASPTKARMQARPEPLEQPELAGVAHR